MADDERMGRRAFLGTTVAGAAGLAIGCGDGTMPMTDAGPDARDAAMARDGGAPPEDGGPTEDGGTDAGAPEPVVPPEDTPEGTTFGLGVASGDVTSEAAILWTRYDGAMPLAAVVWALDASGGYAAQLPRLDVTPADGGFAHVEVTGLTPGARYRYAFFELDGEARVARSPIGAFRAAVGPTSMETLTIGAVSCTNNGRSKEVLERAGERDDLDVFLLLGDTTYNDGASSLADYRDKWAESLESAGWRAVRRVTSVYATWDDHEVDNNFDPERDDTTIARQTFFESLPLRRDATDPDRIWKRFRWGLTAEIFVLDCRGERLPSMDQYLSRAQMDWLKTGLAESPCVFKIVMSSVPIGDFPFPSENDRWEGYPGQREEILRYVDETPIDGLIWVSGDFHFASIGRVGANDRALGWNQREILAGPGAQTGNPASLLCRPPQFDWASTTNNYTTLELDPTRRRARVQWIDRDASVIQSAEIDV
ncbi:MAG: alkaline phosphatase D family protein [Myxococcales bacterium]|nr:alkaline phosphatase D family protein [Myxococcales bacterium]